LGTVLQVAQQVQLERDNRRMAGSPSRTNQGEAVMPKMRKSGTRKQRELSKADLDGIILRTAENAVRLGAQKPLPDRDI
jgi:hypothetical protein